MFNFNFLLVIILSLLSSCAGNYESWVAQTCNYDAAYENGNNDFSEFEKMDSSQYGRCPEDKKAQAYKGYREGYEKARQSESKTTTNGAHFQIGGAHISIGSNRAYYCTIEIFGKLFEAFGATKIEATQNVRKKCAKTNSGVHEIHCGNAVCRKNN